MRVVCWEARTRGATVEVGTSSTGRFILLIKSAELMTPTWARQLADTLYAAADIAEAEEAARVSGT